MLRIILGVFKRPVNVAVGDVRENGIMVDDSQKSTCVTATPQAGSKGKRVRFLLLLKYCSSFIFTSLSAVQIHDFHIFTTVYSPLHGFIWNQHSDQLPVGLLAQLVEHCTGIAEVMGSNPVQAWIFLRPSFHYCLSSVHNYEDGFHIHSLIR